MLVQEKRFEHKGFPCVVLFMPIGYHCGYVGLPKGNKYYGKDYDENPVRTLEYCMEQCKSIVDQILESEAE